MKINVHMKNKLATQNGSTVNATHEFKSRREERLAVRPEARKENDSKKQKQKNGVSFAASLLNAVKKFF